jgi:GST-like protein
MIDLYYWTTPNGHKITLFLEEAGLPYTIRPINIGKGDQFQPDFLRIAPNNRIPAIVDRSPSGGGEPISVFESGAILLYLAEKTGRFLSADVRTRIDALQWLFWQMGGLGPDGRAKPPLHPSTPPNRFPTPSIVTSRKPHASTPCSIAALPTAISSPAPTTPSPTWPATHGSSPITNSARTSMTSPASSAGSRASGSVRPPSAPTPWPSRSIRPSPPMSDEAKKVLFGQDASTVTKP